MLTGQQPEADHAERHHDRAGHAGILVAEAHGGRRAATRWSTTNDARRLAADTLVAYTTPDDAARQPEPAGAASRPRPAGQARTIRWRASGKLQRVEAFGNVSVRTATDIVTGDRGVYVPDTGIARLAGNVRITRGQNQLNGPRPT